MSGLCIFLGPAVPIMWHALMTLPVVPEKVVERCIWMFYELQEVSGDDIKKNSLVCSLVRNFLQVFQRAFTHT